MGATFEATRLVFQGRTGCRGHVSEVIIDGQPWSLSQALVALHLGNQILLRDPERRTASHLVSVICVCGDVTVAPGPRLGPARVR